MSCHPECLHLGINEGTISSSLSFALCFYLGSWAASGASREDPSDRDAEVLRCVLSSQHPFPPLCHLNALVRGLKRCKTSSPTVSLPRQLVVMEGQASTLKLAGWHTRVNPQCLCRADAPCASVDNGTTFPVPGFRSPTR